MKRFFYSVLAAATMLFATTSCSQDEEIVSGGTTQSGTTQKVKFSVQLPDQTESRAIAEGVEVGKANMANTLAWALYESPKSENGKYVYVTGDKKTKQPDSKEFNVEIDMVKGMQYQVLFFAYNEDNNIFGFSDVSKLRELEYKKTDGKYALTANEEAYDAFVASHPHKANEEAVTTVTLYRPFAQINAATTDADLVKAEKLKATVVASELILKNVPTKYDVLTGEVSECMDVVTYAKTDILKQVDNLNKNEILENVDSKNYNYLNMVYVLAGNGTSTTSNHNATFNFYRSGDDTPVRVIEIPNLPIERNWRTNIVGDLLTQTEAFKIVIDENFKGDHNILEGEVVEVSTQQSLQDAINNADGPTIIKFTQDIDKNSTAIESKAASDAASITITQKEGVDLVIDGCGYKFNGTFYLEGKANYTGKETLTFKNIEFETEFSSSDPDASFDFISCNSTESGKRYAHNVTVDNCTFTNTGTSEVVGMRYRQCYDMTVKNSTATNLHSLMWATGGDGITIDNVTVYNCKNGLSFGTTTNLTVKNSNITSEVYGLRADGNSSASLNIKETKINATQPVIVRKLTGTYNVIFEGENNLNSTEENGYEVVLTNDDDEAAYVEPTGSYSIEGANTDWKVFPVRVLHEESGLIYNGNDANWKSVFYLYNAEDLRKAVNYFVHQTQTNEANGVTFVLENDIDFENKEWTPWTVMWITLDGKGHTISNLKVTEGWRGGLFGYLGASKVNNLTLKNVNVTGAQVGILAGAVEGVTTENIKIEGTNSVTYKAYSSPEHIETWGGIGAVTGVLTESTINAEIMEAAKVSIENNGLETNATFVDYLTGYIQKNQGKVVVNGEISIPARVYNGVSYASTMTSQGLTYIISASEEGSTTVRGIIEGNTAITSAVVEEGITVVGERTFRNCSNLTSVTLPSTLTEIASGAFLSSGIESIVIPSSVKTIGKQAFYSCTSLTSVNIPEGVTSIEESAFRQLAVTELTIPSSVTSIGSMAFRDNESLTKLTILSENIKSIGSSAFLNAAAPYPSLTVYVKNETVKNMIETALGTHALSTWAKVEIMENN